MEPTTRKTRDTIVKLIQFNPGISDADMARALGITRQAVGYHTNRLLLNVSGSEPLIRNERKFRRCTGCRKSIQRRNSSGLCWPCWVESHAYEFVCAQCGKLNLLFGHEASRRRGNRKAAPDKADFCGKSCASKYTMKEYWKRKGGVE